MKRANGNWVSGDRFWNRTEELKLLKLKVKEGAHQLVTAQRRMGKTSLLRELAERLKDHYICLFVDLQKAPGPEDAVVALSVATHPYQSLWKKTSGIFSNVLGLIEGVNYGEIGITLRAGLTAANWREKGDSLFQVLSDAEKPVVLMMDEVPILVNRILKGDDFTITPERRREADVFMSWLRENSQRHQGKVTMLISGSIGLEPVLNQAGLSATLNTFSPFVLKPWDAATAKGCLDELAADYGLTFRDSAAEAVVRRLGYCIPHHVQMFFSNIYDRCMRKGAMEFSADEVEEVYQSDMLGIHGHVELNHYEERLKLVLPLESYALALEMLTETAVAGRLDREALAAFASHHHFSQAPLAGIQKEILQVLQHDGYLELGSNGYVFVSPLLRDWWEKRHGFFHTPVLERR